MSLWKSHALVALLAFVANAQFDLPGVDSNEKPGDQNAMDSVVECGRQTNELLSNPEVYSSLTSLRQIAAARLQSDNLCEAKGESIVCKLDYESLETDYKTVCEGNGGIYDENDHQIACATSNGSSSSGPVIYRFTNYPTCFSNQCSDSDVERWIADKVDNFEFDVERDTAWVCDSDYAIEETVPPQAGSSTGTCPNRENDTPEKCGPLASQLQGRQCDCYTFCDGTLVECEKFSSDGASDVFCPGELVMGCTFDLFNQYDSTIQTQLASSGMQAAAVVAGVVSVTAALFL